MLVAHSYGGMVITEAAAQNDAVRALVYVCAFAPEEGESAFALSEKFPGSTLGQALDAYLVSTGGNDLRIKPDLFHHQFCADVPADTAALMAATQRPASDVALTDALPTATPAWKTIPSWFVFSDEDLNIPVALHRFFAERAGAKATREVAGASTPCRCPIRGRHRIDPRRRVRLTPGPTGVHHGLPWETTNSTTDFPWRAGRVRARGWLSPPRKESGS